MRFSQVVVAHYKTIEAIDTVIGCIENDYMNIQGGITAWNSGYTTHMLAGATKKIEALERKSDKIWTAMTKAEYKEHLKSNEFCTFEYYEEHFVC